MIGMGLKGTGDFVLVAATDNFIFGSDCHEKNNIYDSDIFFSYS